MFGSEERLLKSKISSKNKQEFNHSSLVSNNEADSKNL